MCHAKTNELVERLAEREERDWTYFGRLRHERDEKFRDPQDALIEADRPAAAAEEEQGRAARNAANDSPPLAACLALANPAGPSAKADLSRARLTRSGEIASRISSD